MTDTNTKIGIIGLGYVGLPLAVEFSKHFNVVGFDVNHERIENLKKGLDETLEVSFEEISSSKSLIFSSDSLILKDVTVYIVTVPTPINSENYPDLSPLIKASELIGSFLKKDDVVIYESTVYPGATEEICVPILEKNSNLKFNTDFFCGYSPERINPGDKQHRISSITKITSGSTPKTAELVDNLYSKIISAGTFKTSSIRVAEAAKVIENTQRDVNIALMNELSIIFDKLDLDTLEVLEAAGTKWNFLPFRPGLVGGHCIGVDPYYLTFKAKEVGYLPEVILAGRSINDSMGEYVALQLIKEINKKNIDLKNSKVLIMGLTFKEDCPDIRNSKVFDIIKELNENGIRTEAADPLCSHEEVERIHGIKIKNLSGEQKYDAIIVAVAHKQYRNMSYEEISKNLKPKSVFFDLKGCFDKTKSAFRL